jgi:hypothetical protein
MLSSLERAAGQFDWVTAWLTVGGFVNVDLGISRTTALFDPISELISDLCGEAGDHAGTAIGVIGVPLNIPVVMAEEAAAV